MHDTAYLTLNHAQTVAGDLRALLRRLGADAGLASRVVPWADAEGRPSIHIPTLPLDVAERLLARATEGEAAS